MPLIFEPGPDGSQHPALTSVPLRVAEVDPKLTDSDLIERITEPLAQLLPLSDAKPLQRAEALRSMTGQLARTGKMSPGGMFDETNPAGRAALLAELNARCGIT